MSVSLPYLSADLFLHLPPKASPTAASKTLIFFIPGNPGLLGYYHEFLSLLAASSLNSTCTIAGCSLGGFEISASTPPARLAQIQHPEGSPIGPIYSLRDQIDLTFRRVRSLVEALQHGIAPTSAQEDTSRYNVILIGHSVGAYIALEVIRRLHVEYSQLDPDQTPDYTVAGTILLTPTIIDIAKSSHGRVVTPLLAYAPFLDRLAQWAAWGVNGMLPGRVREGLVGRVTGMKGEKLRITLGWLGSEQGVRQTVKMGGEEMREIGGDMWGSEVWGDEQGLEGRGKGEAAGAGRWRWRWKAPKLVLYFARKDHWVDYATREAIVKARRRCDVEGMKDKSWPRIEVEENGELVHGWCIEQSREVAEKVIEWIEEMIE